MLEVLREGWGLLWMVRSKFFAARGMWILVGDLLSSGGQLVNILKGKIKGENSGSRLPTAR